MTKVLSSNDSFGMELDKLGVKFVAAYLDPVFYAINTSIKFIFPSYNGGTYLLFYLLTRLWGEYIISFIFALLFLWAMLYLNHRYENRFFYDEEPYFGATAIFLTGWPGWLYYLIILLTLFLIFNAVGTIMTRTGIKMGSILGHPTTEDRGAEYLGSQMSGEQGEILTSNIMKSDVRGQQNNIWDIGLHGDSQMSGDIGLHRESKSPEASDVGKDQYLGSRTSEEISGTSRFSFYYFWFPVAIAIILLMAYTQQTLPYFNLLKI
ncbi:MAG: hypothetical protein Q8L47_01550 [bacterium]|nr:hypothetical protein [bacterium]